MARARFSLLRTISLAAGLCLASLTGYAAVPTLAQPAWVELTAEQKQILAPLASEWDRMDRFRRSKWLGIAKRYPSLSSDEQTRIQRRMTSWAKLTPEERKQAREKYKSLQKSPPETKESIKQKWQEYKQLPDSEKARLKAEAARKPIVRPGAARAVPLTGAGVTGKQPPGRRESGSPPTAAIPGSPPPASAAPEAVPSPAPSSSSAPSY